VADFPDDGNGDKPKSNFNYLGFAMRFEERCRGSEKAAEHSRAAAAGFKIEYQ
jgi:hypothetical protein